MMLTYSYLSRSRSKKPIYFILVTAFSLIVAAGCSSNDQATPYPLVPFVSPDKNETGSLAASINGEGFTMAELEQEFAFDRVTYKLINERDLVLQDLAGTFQGMIPSLLLDQQARWAGVEATEEELSRRIESYAAGINTTPEILARELEQYGYKLADFRISIARTVRIEKFLDELMADPERAPADLDVWLADLQEQADIEIFFKSAGESPMLGGTAPAFSLKNLEGESVSLAQFLGRPVILNFWATWCLPCREEMPVLQQAYQDYGSEGLIVLAINFEEEVNSIRPYVQELELTFEILSDSQAVVTKNYQLSGLPGTFFIDRQGVIRHVQLGQVREELLEQILDEIL